MLCVSENVQNLALKSGFEMLVVKTLCCEKARRFNCNLTTFIRPYDRYRHTGSLSEPVFIKKIQCRDRPTRPTYPRFIPVGTSSDCNRQRQPINRTAYAFKCLFWFLKTLSLKRCRAINCSSNFFFSLNFAHLHVAIEQIPTLILRSSSNHKNKVFNFKKIQQVRICFSLNYIMLSLK